MRAERERKVINAGDDDGDERVVGEKRVTLKERELLYCGPCQTERLIAGFFADIIY